MSEFKYFGSELTGSDMESIFNSLENGYAVGGAIKAGEQNAPAYMATKIVAALMNSLSQDLTVASDFDSFKELFSNLNLDCLNGLLETDGTKGFKRVTWTTYNSEEALKTVHANPLSPGLYICNILIADNEDGTTARRGFIPMVVNIPNNSSPAETIGGTAYSAEHLVFSPFTYFHKDGLNYHLDQLYLYSDDEESSGYGLKLGQFAFDTINQYYSKLPTVPFYYKIYAKQIGSDYR